MTGAPFAAVGRAAEETGWASASSPSAFAAAAALLLLLMLAAAPMGPRRIRLVRKGLGLAAAPLLASSSSSSASPSLSPLEAAAAAFRRVGKEDERRVHLCLLLLPMVCVDEMC